VDTVTGIGLERALEGADTVVDVTNSPSLGGSAALRFFESSGRNLLSAGKTAGVRHHIALSIVGVDRLLAGEYFRAKKMQEELIEASGIPFTILRSTQFFEFISGVVQEGTASEIAISPALAQPIAGDDVADIVAEVAAGTPVDGRVEIAGPEQFRMDEFFRDALASWNDPREVVTDPHAHYFGAELQERSLLPGPDARIAAFRFADWLRDTLRPNWSPLVVDRAIPLHLD
jgi:uncharacterized protein YbjT (DUF2867 family)